MKKLRTNIDTTKIDTITIGADKYYACYSSFDDNIDFNLQRKKEALDDNKILSFSMLDFPVPFDGWLFNTLEHEILHKVLQHTIGREACKKLDNNIQGKNLELERIKRFKRPLTESIW